jgi:hypothetical protein
VPILRILRILLGRGEKWKVLFGYESEPRGSINDETAILTIQQVSSTSTRLTRPSEDEDISVSRQQVAAGGRNFPREDHVEKEALTAVYRTDYGIHNPASISRFTDMTRQAVAYRDRHVLLAGDAAHVHPPMGGQELNIGVRRLLSGRVNQLQICR